MVISPVDDVESNPLVIELSNVLYGDPATLDSVEYCTPDIVHVADVVLDVKPVVVPSIGGYWYSGKWSSVTVKGRVIVNVSVPLICA